MARIAASVDNTVLRDVLQNYMNFHELPVVYKNVFENSARIGHSNPSSPVALFRALQSLKEINYSAVDGYVNARNRAFGDPDFSRSHVYAFHNRVKFAINTFKYYNLLSN